MVLHCLNTGESCILHLCAHVKWEFLLCFVKQWGRRRKFIFTYLMKYTSTTAHFFTYLINYTSTTAHLKAYLYCGATSSGTNDVHSIWLLTRQNTLIYLQMVCTRSKGRKCGCCINRNLPGFFWVFLNTTLVIIEIVISCYLSFCAIFQ